MEMFTRYGSWELLKPLGRGSFGEVSLWHNVVSKQKVAVKICSSLKSYPPEKRQRIKEQWGNEFRILMTEVNENIVQAVQIEEDFRNALNRSNPCDLPVLVMEYCDGGDLRGLLYNVKNSNGLIEYEVKNVLKALNNAISYLHDKGITHRDLKPENVVIKKNNECNIYKVTDFGYAKDMIATNINSQVGTIGYFAPEVLLDGKYSPTIDYWSMGIIGFEVICGCRPFIPHQTIMKWAEQIRSKLRSTIAITENNTGEFKHHKFLFNENRISSTFKQMIEQWLTLSLDLSHKRGLPVRVPDEVPSTFFREFDKILNKQILTVFCLSTYQFLSYEISNETTLDELLLKITKDTKIPSENLFIILTPEQSPEQMKRPINLILERSDGPMIYVTGVPGYLPNLEKLQPYMSKAVHDFMEKSVELKAFYLMDLARQVLFFRRNENRHYVAFLSGLKNYAVFLNHTISTHQTRVKDIILQNYQIYGALMSYELMLAHSKEKLEDKNIAHLYTDNLVNWENKALKITEDVGKLRDVCHRIERRYDSILRRSNEIINSVPLRDTDQDFFNVKDLETYYDSIRQELNNVKSSKTCPIEKTQRILAFICETLKTRSNLLQDRDLHDIQKTMSEIHVEFMKILQIINDTIKEIHKQNKHIKELTLAHIDDLCMIMENSSVDKYKKSQENIPDLDSIMSSLNLDQKENGENAINFQLSCNNISSLAGMEISCFGEGSDTKSLTEESEQIRIALHHLSQDIDMSISMLRSPEQDFTSQS